MTSPRRSLAERALWPPVLLPEDMAVVLGLGSERAAREFLAKHGVPHARVGTRVFVLADELVGWLRERQQRHPTREELREKADATIRGIAPTARQRRRGRRPPSWRRKSLEMPPADAAACVECGSGPPDGPPARADAAAERTSDG
jgi:hypothetical protein